MLRDFWSQKRTSNLKIIVCEFRFCVYWRWKIGFSVSSNAGSGAKNERRGHYGYAVRKLDTIISSADEISFQTASSDRDFMNESLFIDENSFFQFTKRNLISNHQWKWKPSIMRMMNDFNEWRSMKNEKPRTKYNNWKRFHNRSGHLMLKCYTQHARLCLPIVIHLQQPFMATR